MAPSRPPSTVLIGNGNNTPRNGNSGTSELAADQGSLTAEFLSVYDLPFSEPPLYVTLSVGRLRVQTGPPFAKHKDRNSFRFSAPSMSNSNGNNGNSSPTFPGNSATVQVKAPLPELYKSTATIRIVYTNNPALEATYELKQLKIHQTQWLILTLTSPSEAPPTPASKKKPAPGYSSSSGGVLVSTVSEDDSDIAPTIRLKIKLVGPYRPEIAALVGLAQGWFGLVDDGLGKTSEALGQVPKPSSPLWVLPAVPIVGAFVVVSPVIAGLAMIFLPVVLPIVLIVIAIGLVFLVSGGFLYFSSASGRDQMSVLFGPVLDSFVSSRAGQRLIYETGPRPTPVSVARLILPQESLWGKLIVSLLIDLVGSSSYLLPIVGEATDLAWAPIQTIMIMAMYDQRSPLLKYVSFIEEILPFTDIVPTATIGFLLEFVPKVLFGGAISPEEADQLLSTAIQVSSSNRAGSGGRSNVSMASMKTVKTRPRNNPYR